MMDEFRGIMFSVRVGNRDQWVDFNMYFMIFTKINPINYYGLL